MLAGIRTTAGRHRRLDQHLPSVAAAAAPVSGGWAVLQTGRTLALCGEFDVAARDQLERVTATFARRCAGTDSPRISDAVIDAAELRFIDAGSLGVLVTLHNSLADAGIRLHTRRASDSFRRICGICGLDATLGLEPTASAPAITRVLQRRREARTAQLAEPHRLAPTPQTEPRP